jgi:amidohydrolase
MSSDQIDALVKPHLKRLIQIRHQIHQNPELGYQEQATSAIVQRELNEAGVEVQRVGKTGVVGLIRGKGRGRCVALRADMDALAMEDKTGLPYASTNGNAHACGHDGHTTILIGAAHALAAMRDKFAGSIKLIFQPAEEGGFGGKFMADAGVMSNPKVEAIFGLHSHPTFPLGKVGLKSGAISAWGDRLKIVIRGRGAHGAQPQQSADPIIAAARLVEGLQTIVSRNLTPGTQAVVSICTIHGGTASNVIPDTVELTGTLRSLDSETRETLWSGVKRVCSGVAKTCDVKCKPTFKEGYPSVVNHPELVEMGARLIERQLGADAAVRIERASTGAEDFSYYLAHAPGCFYRLGTATSDEIVPLHSPRFDFPDAAIPIGIKLLAGSALEALKAKTLPKPMKI